MTRNLLLAVIIVASLLSPQGGSAQQPGKLDSLFAKGDTTAVMDSLMKDFDAFVDSLSRPKSFLSIGVGVGNRTFSIKNNSLNAQESSTRQLSFTPTIGYYHKSGLGITVTGFVSTVNNNLMFYQYALTPSYDYIGAKISTGISYTRYFGKNEAIQNTSPYENDIYGYFNLHHNSWRYGISAGYATGSFSDKLSYRDSILRFNNITQRLEWFRYLVTVNSNNEIKDFSLAASLRKDFEWYRILKKNDNLTFSITSYLVAGSTRIQTSNNVNFSSRKIILSRFKRSYATDSGNNFQLQSTALSFSLFYTVGKFNLQPIWFLDYYFPDTEQKVNQIFSLALAFTF